MRNLKLIVTYDGSRYQGWQRLPGVAHTIQGKLESTLSRILNEPVEVDGSGRTDAGAHAMGQCVSFHCQSPLPCSEILSQLWMHLPEDIGVLSCEEVPPRFHARLNATAKTYEYRVWNSLAPCVFQRKYCYRLPIPLELDRMREAAALLVGQHDFRSFCSNKKMKKSTVRTIYSLELTASGPDLRFIVRGDGFLYNMVRLYGPGPRSFFDGGGVSMNIQIFGTSKCFDTKKAERYFKERRIPFQRIDLSRFGMSGGEFDSVVRALGGIDNLINWDSKSEETTFLRYTDDLRTKEDRVFENPKLMKTPVVRNGRQATAGYCPEVWAEWK